MSQVQAACPADASHNVSSHQHSLCGHVQHAPSRRGPRPCTLAGPADNFDVRCTCCDLHWLSVWLRAGGPLLLRSGPSSSAPLRKLERHRVRSLRGGAHASGLRDVRQLPRRAALPHVAAGRRVAGADKLERGGVRCARRNSGTLAQHKGPRRVGRPRPTSWHATRQQHQCLADGALRPLQQASQHCIPLSACLASPPERIQQVTLQLAVSGLTVVPTPAVQLSSGYAAGGGVYAIERMVAGRRQ
jgi:hypothetical protein